MVDSLGISVPVGILVAPSENSSSIQSHLDHLKIDNNPSHDLYGSTYCVIMTDEGSELLKCHHPYQVIIIAYVRFMSISLTIE